MTTNDSLKKEDASVFSLLTTRERGVLQLLVEGKTTKEISLHLGVSIKTVETYRQQIMDRLNIHSLAELTKYAVREGSTSLED
jgi:DNA-binding NarL/FixJ family response regulator